MDGRSSHYIGEVYRGEDASYPKRSELNELLRIRHVSTPSMGKIGKVIKKSRWMITLVRRWWSDVTQYRNLLEEYSGCWSELIVEIRSWWRSTWKDTLTVQISTWRNYWDFIKLFMWWRNAICDSTLLIVIGFMNTQEDPHRVENQQWRNSQKNQPYMVKELVCRLFTRCDQTRVSVFGRQRDSLETVGE